MKKYAYKKPGSYFGIDSIYYYYYYKLLLYIIFIIIFSKLPKTIWEEFKGQIVFNFQFLNNKIYYPTHPRVCDSKALDNTIQCWVIFDFNWTHFQKNINVQTK